MCLCVCQGYVRFREEGAATKAREGLLERAVGNSVPQLCGADTELRVLEGQCVHWGGEGGLSECVCV